MHIRAARIIYGLDWDMSAEEVVMNTRWTTLQSTYKLTLSRLGDWNLPALILNADISITVTAMTLTFHDFSKKYIVSMGRKNGEKILCKKNVTEYS